MPIILTNGRITLRDVLAEPELQYRFLADKHSLRVTDGTFRSLLLFSLDCILDQPDAYYFPVTFAKQLVRLGQTRITIDVFGKLLTLLYHASAKGQIDPMYQSFKKLYKLENLESRERELRIQQYKDTIIYIIRYTVDNIGIYGSRSGITLHECLIAYSDTIQKTLPMDIIEKLQKSSESRK